MKNWFAKAVATPPREIRVSREPRIVWTQQDGSYWRNVLASEAGRKATSVLQDAIVASAFDPTTTDEFRRGMVEMYSRFVTLQAADTAAAEARRKVEDADQTTMQDLPNGRG